MTCWSYSHTCLMTRKQSLRTTALLKSVQNFVGKFIAGRPFPLQTPHSSNIWSLGCLIQKSPGRTHCWVTASILNIALTTSLSLGNPRACSKKGISGKCNWEVQSCHTSRTFMGKSTVLPFLKGSSFLVVRDKGSAKGRESCCQGEQK